MRELGWDLMSQGRLDAAVKVLALNVEAYPASSGAHSLLAEAYNRVGEREKALAGCRTALQLYSDNADAASLMAEISSAETLAE